MLKVSFLIVFTIALIAFASRFVISTSGFMQGGIMENIQACKRDDDCVWVPSDCCGCQAGGGEIVVHKEKVLIYNLFVKPICLGEASCSLENACHDEEIFCDKTCQFGKRTVTKPLLAQ